MSKPWHSLVFEKRVKKKLHCFELPVLDVPLADTHGHLTCYWTKDPAETLARAALAGVRQFTTLVDPVGDEIFPDYVTWLREQLSRARELLEELPLELVPTTLDTSPLDLLDKVRFLVGVHPYGAARYNEVVQGAIEKLLGDGLCAGVGEIGLDYHFDSDAAATPVPHDVQLFCMKQQLACAIAHDLPVELHLRNDAHDTARQAHQDAYQLLCELGLPQAGCVLHCFSEDRATMERFCELGCFIAFGGAATFKQNEGLREAFIACPLEHLLFETDCPYMAPEPLRGVECESALMTFTVSVLSQLRSDCTGEDRVCIQRSAWENACQLFLHG